jgi:hypothetical protein
MAENIRICKKNVKLWEERIERMTPTRPKDARGGA